MYRTNLPEGHEGDALPFKISPAYILAYGPHVPLRKSQEILSPVEYQVYLYHVLEPLDLPFYFACGNLPRVPIDLLSLETALEFIAKTVSGSIYLHIISSTHL